MTHAFMRLCGEGHLPADLGTLWGGVSCLRGGPSSMEEGKAEEDGGRSPQ